MHPCADGVRCINVLGELGASMCWGELGASMCWGELVASMCWGS